ncbi:uncharacterized protein RSE6_05535 [Rhynchosporium secalis]|uniref:Fork-head domain-containing protein n=1 Tax=Rhynchosporium secalis TaxID=38038 RepID=A0A1E1M828_RHYSE|nr:uncharacterized protein RSE6_05535 [Rhynchosporium secalis]
MAENELPISHESEPAAMTSSVATAPPDNLFQQHYNSINEPTRVAKPEHAIDGAQQGLPVEENIPPLDGTQMGELGVQVAPVDMVVEGAKRLSSSAAEPAIPELDISQAQAQIDALAGDEVLLERMLQHGSFMPELMRGVEYSGPKELHVALPAGIALDGQMPISNSWHGIDQTVSIPIPLLYQDGTQYNQNSAFGSDQQLPAAENRQQTKGYAKLEFPDAPYFITTYEVMIGRDMRAHKSYLRGELGARQVTSSRPPRSIVSQRGGIVRDFLEEDDEEKGIGRKRKRKDRNSDKPHKHMKVSRSSGSSSHNRSRRPSVATLTDDSQHAYSDSERPAAVDVERHLPDPHKRARLYIHPPAAASAGQWKAISRNHLLIRYNFVKNIWEAEIQGINGCFVGGTLYPQYDIFELTNGLKLQIGAIEIYFRLPEDVPCCKTGADLIEAFHANDDDSGEDSQEHNEQIVYTESGKPMSIGFGTDRREGVGLDQESDSDGYGDENVLDEDFESASDDEDDRGIDIDQSQMSSDDQDLDEREEDGEEEEDEDEDIEIDDGVGFDFDSLRPEPEPISRPQTPQPKKRGVGRPPKNGISKRQQKEDARRLAQEASTKKLKNVSQKEPKVSKPPKKPKEPKEPKQPKKSTKLLEVGESDTAKQSIEADTEAETPTQESGNTSNKVASDEKRKVGRPRKHPRPDAPPEPREKRKYTKRKPKEPKDGEPQVEGAAGDDVDKGSSPKPPRSPRSPTPTWDLDKLTAEEKAKPPQNYLKLLFEILTESPRKQMSLPQIYRALLRKHAYYATVKPSGWQSSVRHNLGQNDCFQKVERDGKGWKWAVKEGATYEKEKKKKPSPSPQYPPGHMQPIYPGYGSQYQVYPPQGYPPGPQGYSAPGSMGPHMGPMGYQMHHQMPPNYHPGQQQAPYVGPGGRQAPINGGYQAGYQPPMYSQPPVTLPPALATVNVSYSSPYGPKKPDASSGPPTNQPGPSASQSVTLGIQQGLPPDQPVASTSQTAPSTTAQPASSTGHSGLLTSQPGFGPKEGTHTQTTQALQVESSMNSPASASQPGSTTDQMGQSNSQAGRPASQYPQESGPLSTPVSQPGNQYVRQPNHPKYGQSQQFAQSFTPQQTHPNSQPYQPQPQPQPQPQTQIAGPSPSQSQTVQLDGMSTTPAPVSEKLATAVQSFRKALSNEMSTRPHGLATLDRAVGKVLGHISVDAPPVYPDENQIVDSLQDMLRRIGIPPPHISASSLSGQTLSTIASTPAPQSQSSQPASHSGTQASASQSHPPARSTGSERSSPAITRPLFTPNQNRQSGNAIPRPPMNSWGRSNSNGSSAPVRQQTPVGSPAPAANIPNGASTPVPTDEISLVGEAQKELSELVPIDSESELVVEQLPPSLPAAETKPQAETQS